VIGTFNVKALPLTATVAPAMSAEHSLFSKVAGDLAPPAATRLRYRSIN